jgi:hypothetical protein
MSAGFVIHLDLLALAVVLAVVGLPWVAGAIIALAIFQTLAAAWEQASRRG